MVSRFTLSQSFNYGLISFTKNFSNQRSVLSVYRPRLRSKTSGCIHLLNNQRSCLSLGFLLDTSRLTVQRDFRAKYIQSLINCLADFIFTALDWTCAFFRKRPVLCLSRTALSPAVLGNRERTTFIFSFLLSKNLNIKPQMRLESYHTLELLKVLFQCRAYCSIIIGIIC